MPTVSEIAADLAAEHQDLDPILGGLTETEWGSSTASPGWSVADQIGHLAYFDHTAAMAIVEPDDFKVHLTEMMGRLSSGGTDFTLEASRSLAPTQLLVSWRTESAALIEAASHLDETTRLPWYGPDMGAKSFLTARLMETWAHGQDVCDTIDVSRQPTDRLRHIAQLGVITRGWSYINRNLEPSLTPVFVQLTAPSGATWQWGEPDANESVTGPAVDFCQVVTQRRAATDTHLSVTGDAASEWMSIAQAFAGGASDGPKPGSAS